MSRAASRRSGDEYQDIVALSMLVDWLADPSLYSTLQLEADDAGALDDIVTVTPDGNRIATQVKFTVTPETGLDWDELLRQRRGTKGPLPSLLGRWASSLRMLSDESSAVVGQLVTNRQAGEQIAEALDSDKRVDVSRLDADLREEVFRACDGEEAATEFLSAFEFHFSRPSLHQLSRDTRSRFQELGGSDQHWLALREDVRLWILSPDLLGDGVVTYQALLRAAGWRLLQGLHQEFPIPGNYEAPESDFITKIRSRTSAGGVHVLTGGPGTGKSTFLSFLYKRLKAENRNVVRHHYFLALNQPQTRRRLPYQTVAESLMHDLQEEMPEALRDLSVRNPTSGELREWLEACGAHARETDSPLLVIVDGLDHAWREERSAAVLEELFDTLLPVPIGVGVLVGTQPLDDKHLPRKLLTEAPRDQWLQIPGLTETQIRRLVESSKLWRGDGPANHLDDLVVALTNKTEGNPLHLHYTLSALLEQRMTVDAEAVRRLPGCPHRDIVDYYRYLWVDLDESARLLLHSICASDVPWPRRALLDSAEHRSSLGAAMEALSSVNHLLRAEPLGMRPFHQSLAVYVRELPEHQDLRIGALGELATWVENEGSAFHKWAFTWRLQRASGDDSSLLANVTLGWAREACRLQFPSNFALDIVADAREAALDARDLVSAIRCALVDDYYGRTYDDDRLAASEMLALVRLRQDYDALSPSYRESIPYLPSEHLAWAARVARESGDSEMASLGLDELNERLVSRRTEGTWDFFSQYLDALIIVAVNCDSISAERIAEFVGRLDPDDVARASDAIGRECRRAGLLDRMRSIGSGLPPAAKSALERHSVAAAVEQGAWQTISTSSIFGAAAFAIRDGASFDLTPPPLQILGLEDHLVYSATHEAARALIELFWWALSRGSLGTDLDISTVRSGWLQSFVSRWVQVAGTLSAGDKSEPWIEALLDSFSNLDLPTWSSDREGTAWLPVARRAINEAIQDLSSLRVAQDSAATLSSRELKAILLSKFVSLTSMLHSSLSTKRVFLDVDACERLDELNPVEFAGEFQEMAETYSRIAAALATHSHTCEAWVTLAADCAVAHGQHKDMVLFLAVEMAEVALESGFEEGRSWLLALAPGVSAILDFTDGDETNHLAVEYGGALGRRDPQHLPGLYEWLIDSHRYSAARDVISELTTSGDLEDEIVRTLVSTITEPILVEHLEARGRRGEILAEEIAGDLRRRVPRPQVSPDATGATSTPTASSLTGQEPPDPATYDFSDLDGFLQSARYPFDRGGLLGTWLNHWSERASPDEILGQIERTTQGFKLFGAAAGVARFTLDNLGFDRAYPWIVRAFRESHGWERYWRDKSDALQWWELIKKYAAERWLDFAIETLRPEPGDDPERAFNWNAAVRLSEYAVFMGHPEVAVGLADEFVRLSIDLVSPYPAAPVPWMN